MRTCAPWCEPFTRIRTCKITKWETFPRLGVHDGKTLPRIRSCKFTKWETGPSLTVFTRIKTCYITKWETLPSLGVKIMHIYKMGNVPKSQCVPVLHDALHSQSLEHAKIPNGKRSQVLVFRSCTFTKRETFPSLNAYLCYMMRSHSQELEHAKLPNGKRSQSLLFLMGKHSQE